MAIARELLMLTTMIKRKMMAMVVVIVIIAEMKFCDQIMVIMRKSIATKEEDAPEDEL